MATPSLPAAQRRFRLRAFLLCHDVRFSSEVEAVVALDQDPTSSEAERLLRPTADTLMAKLGFEGYRYELSTVRITPV